MESGRLCRGYKRYVNLWSSKMSCISVVIPSYNHSRFIKIAVESVLRQTHTNLELIVIDDGSTDSSLDYLRTVKDDRYTLIEQLNAGAHNAINRGLEIAQGEYLTILNSDDVYHPQRLEKCLIQLKNGADLVCSWLQVIDEKGKCLGVKEGWKNMLPWEVSQLKNLTAKTYPFSLQLLLSNFVSTTSNMIFTRTLYNRIGGMANLRFAHDWDFLLRAAKSFNCEIIEAPLVEYRIHNKNTISSNRSWMMFEICWIYAVHTAAVLNSFPTQITHYDLDTEKAYLLGEIISAQGNEKIIRMILQYIDFQRNAGVIDPEAHLLENKLLRDEFIRHIV